MTPKKAIIVVLALFVVMVIAVIFLYLKFQLISLKQPFSNFKPDSNQPTAPSTPTQAVQEKINKIIEEAEKNPSQYSEAKVREDIIKTINQEIIKQEQNQTPEEKAAEEKARQERQRIIEQINNQIK